jgi:hypothetical protein
MMMLDMEAWNAKIHSADNGNLTFRVQTDIPQEAVEKNMHVYQHKKGYSQPSLDRTPRHDTNVYATELKAIAMASVKGIVLRPYLFSKSNPVTV